MADYYDTLGVPRTATETQIKQAYRQLALRWHPDKNPDNLDEANRRFREISEAYEVLSNATKRKAYDNPGRSGGNTQSGQRRNGRTAFNFDNLNVFEDFAFLFRSPHEVFQEFFGSSTASDDLFFADMMGPSTSQRRQNRASNSHDGEARSGNLFSTTLVMDTQGPSGSSRRAGIVQSTSITTKYINGKKYTTKRLLKDGKEIVYHYEDDVLKSKDSRQVEGGRK